MHQKFTHCYAARSLMGIFCLLLPCIYSVAQKSTQPGRNVTLTSSRIALGDVFNVIEKQTGILLFFGDLNTNQTVGVKFVATPVEEALGEMLPPIGLTYEYVKGNKDKIFIKSIMPTKKDTVMMTSISGVVTDEKGEPLPGASVRVKGTNVGTATERNGSFTLRRNSEKDVLQISFMGFTMEEVAVGGRANVKVRLKQEDNSLRVVTAYGTTEQKALTGAVTVVKGEQIQSLPNRSFDKSLQGLVPGLMVTGGTGQPGGGMSNFVLRGIATAADPQNGSTVRNPLIVIDGIPVSQDPLQLTVRSSATPISNPLSQLNPSDIESISVLKDASAISLYGSRASNGVLLVTTKKGKSGKTTVSFRHQTDISTPLMGKTKVLNQQEYLGLLRDTYLASGYTEEMYLGDLHSKFPYKVPSAGDTLFYDADNWKNNLYKKAATTLSNEISISGGNENSNFYINLEYTKQNGVARATGYDRKSLRINFENRLSDWIKMGILSSFSYGKQDYSSTGHDATNIALVDLMSPLNPARLDNGSYILNYKWGTVISPTLQANPVAAAEYNLNRNTSYTGLGKVYAEIKLLPFCSFTSSLGTNFILTEAKEKTDPRLISDDGYDVGIGSVAERDIRRASFIFNNILRVTRSLGEKNNFNILLGQEVQMLNEKSLLVKVTGLKLPYYDQISSPGTKLQSFNGATARENLLSYFGQINYDYDNKYLLSASVRRDGSSRFGSDRKFGDYWSVGAGWVLTKESFLSDQKWIDFLKIRGSVGAAGNASAINYSTKYDRINLVDISDGLAIYPTTQPGNPDVQWEQTLSTDIGLEAQLFRNKLSLNVDAYKRNTSDLIYLINLPFNSGYYSVLSNIGKMQNRGIEITVSGNIIQNKNFIWRANATWSTNQNKLVRADVSESVLKTDQLANEEGRNFNSFYLPIWEGANQEDGKPMWRDGNGKATDDYSSAPRTFVGKPQPDAFGAITNTFTHKNIELSLMLYYQYGFQIYNNAFRSLNSDGENPFVNQSVDALNRWEKQGDKASNPRRYLNNIDGGTRHSTRYLFDGDFLRVKNIRLSYRLMGEQLERVNISMLTFFLQADNLLIITKYPGQDPDNVSTVGTVNFPYPNQRNFSLGVNMKL
ncbi:TonB-linked outer membrane protein, SusC/RagA family [Chitinophaga sp. YR627]|uniref:SusC/RagA family TonB-linked outer membrane protein n=1 Tax=Chitinophaga sp. YR627 TaxID=1881041 RepID=UPI0008E5109D|nr:SusC/RagA family TonB-linked outer membrane protein [Chitinophaga sp. YR627]SFN88296.1 TonB-linked outer membrane protein, SusC/RagA family [Chitinophaga sp. YR627]